MSKVLDLDATYYQHNSQPQFERAQELLKSLSLEQNSSVLDVGCGYGNIIADISQRSPKGSSFGVDGSADMIRLAQETFPQSQFPNLRFLANKAEELDFKENSFDAIICFSCLLWVREPKKALDLMCKFLKPGGTLLILTYSKESAYISFLEKTLEEFPAYQTLSATHTMLSIEGHKNILESAGLILEKFIPEWRVSKYKNQEELKNYLRGWLTCFVPLPNVIQEDFLEKAVCASQMANVSSVEAEIRLPYLQLAIQAKKL